MGAQPRGIQFVALSRGQWQDADPLYIEPDGDITIGRVLQSPDKDLERKVIRVIRRSRGKWTPRKVNGVPQRTSYEFRCNYIGNAY